MSSFDLIMLLYFSNAVLLGSIRVLHEQTLDCWKILEQTLVYYFTSNIRHPNQINKMAMRMKKLYSSKGSNLRG